VRDFDDSIELCFLVEEDEDEDTACLGFYHEPSGEWECEDNCPKRLKSNELCGDTNHLTTFSILLDSTGNENSPCGGSSAGVDLVLTWVSAGMVLCFCCMSVLVTVAYEVHIRQKKRRFQSTMTSIERNLGSVHAEHPST